MADEILLEETQGTLSPAQNETQKPVGDLGDDSSTISDQELDDLINQALAENTDGVTTFLNQSNGASTTGVGDDDDLDDLDDDDGDLDDDDNDFQTIGGTDDDGLDGDDDDGDLDDLDDDDNGFQTIGGTDDDDDDDDLEDDNGIDRRRTVLGRDDDDLIVATGDNEKIFGNQGEDTIKGNRGRKNTIFGGKGNDDCEGGEDDDVIKGDRGNDKVNGGKGNDTLNGGKDNDTVIGGEGNDDCEGDDGDDWVHGKEGKDKVKGGAGNDSIYGGKDDDDCKGDEGNDNVRGDRGNDDCEGGDGNDTVNGGKDNDTVKGGAGSDKCEGDDGDDSVSGGTGNDTVNGGGDSDVCSGDDGDDSVSGGTGNDTVSGGGDSDVCSGDDGDDSVSGGIGDDTVSGDAGNDLCEGDDGDDSVMGGAGDDSVMGGGGNDTLVTGDGNDVADGGQGDDSVSGGGDGNDTLMGGDGNDTLMGGTGNHTCVGGAGNDVYVVSNSTSGASAVITDFADNEDKFLLFGDLNFSSLTFIQIGVNTEIRVNNFAIALLLNVNATLITAADFLGVNPQTPTQPQTPTPTQPQTPIFNPPQLEVSETLIAGSSGQEQTITSELLRVSDTGQGPGGITFTLTELPPATTGQLFVNGVPVTQTGVTFTQEDINAGRVTFRAAVGFVGAATFGFQATNGQRALTGKTFSLKIEQDSFNFAGNPEGQAIAGSATLPNNIVGSEGDDNITAGQGKDTIIGGKGKDTIIGGDGDDDIDGGDDDDYIEVGLGKNKIKTGQGNDKVKGGNDNDDIDGGDDDDNIEAGGGDDTVIGGSGNDTLTGNEGNDTIEGGEGTNILSGGPGSDRFVYRTSRQQIQTVVEADFITDFDVNNDVLELSNAAFNVGASILTEVKITATSTFGSIGSGNFLDFTTDISVNSIARLQARFVELGGNPDVPVFCQFIDAETGRVVVVYGVAGRLDIVASFSLNVRLTVNNFVFIGEPLTIPVGTAGADNVDFTTSPAPVNYDGLAGDDKIVGSNFNDSLKGGDGNDTITGGLGLDFISGGTGSDLFVYRTTKEGGDKISDFTVGVDKFEFSASAFGNLTTTNFDGVSGSTPDITGKEFVIFTGGSYASLEAAQAKALGNSTTAGFFAFTNAANETVLYFDSNGTAAGGSTLIANLGTAASNLGTADFVFTGTIAPSAGTTTNSGSIVDLTAAGNTYPSDFNNFGSGAGGYNFTTPVLFTGDAKANSVTGTEFADIFSGGSGADVLTGGAGADLFVYKAVGEGGDTITDFTAGTDKFQFTASAFGNLTTTNFDGVSGSTPDITGKEFVIFTGGSYASLEAAQAKALGNSTTAGFFAFTNAANETVLYFDSNGTAADGSTLIANLGTAASNLGTADFVFTGTIASSVAGTTTNSGSVADLTAAGNTFPTDFNNFGSGAGGYNFTSPVLFTGNDSANSVTGTEFADIFSGGSGADVLTGGAGADLFVYKAVGEGGDTITDFTAGTDKFQFTASAFGNLTTTNFDAVSGSNPDITGKELVIFTGGSYASLEAAQATALGNSTTAGFFAFTNASNETVLYFDSNGTVAGGSTLIANLGTAASNLGTADFVFTGTIASSDTGTSPTGTTTSSGSVADLTAAGNTFPVAFNNFGSGAGGYNFTSPVLFTGNDSANSVTGTEFADIFSGGSGADVLTGGAGADLFVYKAVGEGGDTITDFTAGTDKFQFTASAFGNLTTTNFDAVSGSNPDITGKELVIFTGGSYASLEAAQAKALGNSTTAGFFAFTNASNETVLYFDSNGTVAGGSTLIANLGTAASNLGTADFVFTGTIAPSASGTTTSSGSVADLTAAGNTFPTAFNNFGSGAGGYNFTSPVLFTGDASANSVTGTEFADIFSGGSGADIFDGGLGNDSISGDDGNDSLFGGGGSDTLNGGIGNDTLIGGVGTNVLNGGAGLDVFVFSGTTAGGGDVITNYSIADDVINLDSTGFAAFTTGSGPLASSFYAYSSTVSDVTVFEATLTGPSIMAIYDGLSTKLYYDSNGSTVGGNSLFATVDVNLGPTGNSELFLF
ncbi:cadherin-like domain-containing protein [Microcoleus sp. POL10_C6]|uniref:cadherin-like domain-containing protein n=1 Tax=Microcoleus sp. POL10_C6 TaxID=2818852 RepID=UPI002FCE72E6